MEHPIASQHAECNGLGDGDDVHEDGLREDLDDLQDEVQVVGAARQRAEHVPRGEEAVREFGDALAVALGLGSV